ncbi:exonuclease SbcCD subunit D [Saccharibacillus sp. CPCC 101409]|uniref:exonuclease SbcCD subunit D n=1 Tax=Saccharibacillus sp. CPCC 101409 TaxID=3058041 RepID=UPI002673D7F6|nr:exonuclease SbcCD subunit D [Saccharibacillus sp. CPCC 101409]MDO3409162.1 exonuclease SbcCD subunit D [Saccharibacillus sp. CPCC 101409]
MRVLHTADWHLGRTLEGRSRFEEQEKFMDELVEIVRSERVDLILMAGDVYDTVNPPAAAEQLFYEGAARLRAEGCLLAAIAGNHDHPERVASVRPLVKGSGISLVGLPTEQALNFDIARTGEKAVVAALPYPSEARLNELLIADGTDENLLRRAYSERVGLLMRKLAAGFSPKTVNLAMSHIYVLGGLESDSERPIQVGGAYTVDPSALSCGAQYTALGHLHRPQAVKGDGIIRYSGSPIAYSFSEAGQTKSVMLMDVEPGGEPRLNEIYLSCGRPLVEWNALEGMSQVYAWLEEGRDAGAFIDLRLTLTEAMSLAEIQSLRRARDGLVHIRPVYPQLEEADAPEQRSRLPMHELFKTFYRRQTGGAEPDDALVGLFLELAEENGETTEGGDAE